MSRKKDDTSAHQAHASKKELSISLLHQITTFITRVDKTLHPSEITVCATAKVYGVGRFGRVMGGTVGTGVVERRRREEGVWVGGATPGVVTAAEDSSTPDSSTPMAVKVVQHRQPYMPPALAKNTLHELLALERCAGPSVLPLYGLAHTPPTVQIVTPLYNQGSLYSLVRSKAWKQVESKDRFKMYREMAEGLATIHGSNTIHGDVKSHNMLVDFDEKEKVWTAVVGDLGGAVFLEKSTDRSTVEQGTCGWTAPEVFAGGASGAGHGMKSDVFSFALVLCDSANNGLPPPSWPGPHDTYADRVRAGERPQLPPGDGTGLQQMIEYCWKTEEEERPEMVQVKERLEEIERHL